MLINKPIIFVLFWLSHAVIAQKSSFEKAFEGAMSPFQNLLEDDYNNYETYTFADTLMVRAAASLRAKAVDTLYVGHDITIIETLVRQKIGNRDFPWFKISYKANQKTKIGYVWGGLLSYKAMRRGNTKFVYGTPKIVKIKQKNGIYETWTVELKAIQNNQTIARTSVQIDAASGGIGQ